MHTRLDQIQTRIEHDMQGRGRHDRWSYRFKLAHASLHRVHGDSFFASWCRKMENRLGITIEVDTLPHDEVFLNVFWVERVPA